ncbi:hypothetical protein SD70_28005 [Gordoniibacillus kamchatkensis]|uniref:Uncharacterized protein n=1 Tax=Gordoniibacillus kamchatkensis TaxID=1590651 RepID=A0ABR5AAW4_9BACL|nr:hypothetical protein SD70_28005 [Paenibacillus sp. VKM B-2647]
MYWRLDGLVIITTFRQLPYYGLSGILHHEHERHRLSHTIGVATRGIVRSATIAMHSSPVQSEHDRFERQQPFARIRDEMKKASSSAETGNFP